MNSNAESQLQWLVDRAQIGDLLYKFAAALDTKEWAAYVENFAAEGYIDLPDPKSAVGGRVILDRSQMLEALPKSLGRYSATHHLSTNHQITIAGLQATSRSYLQAVHVSGAMTNHWSAGGWYDCRYRREGDGWKFMQVCLTAVWVDGEVGAIAPDK